MSGIFMMYTFLHAPADSPRLQTAEPFPWLVALVPVGLSIVIRWAVLPRAKVVQQALVFMIVGISFAESTMFLGLFIFATHQQELFIASALGIFQFMPIYAARY